LGALFYLEALGDHLNHLMVEPALLGDECRKP
jgi:hypothetical protein